MRMSCKDPNAWISLNILATQLGTVVVSSITPMRRGIARAFLRAIAQEFLCYSRAGLRTRHQESATGRDACPTRLEVGQALVGQASVPANSGRPCPPHC